MAWKAFEDKILSVTAQAPGEIQPGVLLIGANFVWPFTRGDGVKVAILDTGCDPTHPALKGRIKAGRCFCRGSGYDEDTWWDDHYHGTHVAGSIAADGGIGVAPGVELLIGKVLDSNGHGEYDWVAAGIRWAADQGAHIINLSLGGPEPSAVVDAAGQYAVSKGSLVVCASGNEGPMTVLYPAFYPWATSVGAVDFLGRVASFSSSNDQVDVAGPGVQIYSCQPGGQYVELSGTSMATPHVSGIGALLAAKHLAIFGRRPTEPELFTLLKHSTVDVDEFGVDAATGAGLASFLPYVGDPYPRPEPPPGVGKEIVLYAKYSDPTKLGDGLWRLQEGAFAQSDGPSKMADIMEPILVAGGAAVRRVGC